MSRPVAIVTGSNCGVGFFTARALACAGYVVVVAARSPDKGEAAASQICDAARACGSPGYAVFVRLDLSSLASVRGFAQRIRDDWSVVHALVLNAGMNSFKLSEAERRTADGFDVTFQTNYIGHFLLARELMPLLRSTAATPGCSAPCRLVTLSSTTHRLVRRRDIDWAAAFRTRDSSFSGMSTYTLSKLAMAMLALEWQRRLDAAGEGARVACVAANPGAVRSSIWRRVPSWGAGCWDAFMAVAFLSSEQGAATSVAAATAPLVGDAGSGAAGLRIRPGAYLVPYRVPAGASEPWATLAESLGGFAGPQEAKMTAVAYDEGLAARLWAASEDATKA